MLTLAPAAQADLTTSPWGLVGLANDAGMNLAWQAPAYAGWGIEYRVYRSVEAEDFTLLAVTTDRFFLDAEAGTTSSGSLTFTYYVTAFYAGQESGPSNRAQAYPHCNPVMVNLGDLPPVVPHPNPTSCMLPVAVPQRADSPLSGILEPYQGKASLGIQLEK